MYEALTSPRLDAAFSALADPTRRAILAQLATGERTVSELVEPFELSQPAISRHLKVLEGAGLIVRSVDGNRRPSRLAPNALQEIDAWLSMLRAALEANYERLDDLLAELTAGADPESTSADPGAGTTTNDDASCATEVDTADRDTASTDEPRPTTRRTARRRDPQHASAGTKHDQRRPKTPAATRRRAPDERRPPARATERTPSPVTQPTAPPQRGRAQTEEAAGTRKKRRK